MGLECRCQCEATFVAGVRATVRPRPLPATATTHHGYVRIRPGGSKCPTPHDSTAGACRETSDRRNVIATETDRAACREAGHGRLHSAPEIRQRGTDVRQLCGRHYHGPSRRWVHSGTGRSRTASAWLQRYNASGHRQHNASKRDLTGKHWYRDTSECACVSDGNSAAGHQPGGRHSLV